MKVSLLQVSPGAERSILYIARVSNPKNQESEDTGLINYLIKHGHWSPFEHAWMTLEIETSVAIAAQITRHWSFRFQQFSTRYSNLFDSGLNFEPVELRLQSEKNRQGGEELLDPKGEEYAYLNDRIDTIQKYCTGLYEELLKAGIAREVARMVLPQCAGTRMYMSGDVRSFIHWIDLRTKPDTQKEHREIALAAKEIFSEQFPVIYKALVKHYNW